MRTTALDAHAPIADLIDDVRSGNTWLWRGVIGMGVVLAAALVAGHFDGRLINGVGIWDKPMKFALSLAVQFATVSWVIAQLPEAKRHARGIGIAILVMMFWSWTEMAYISLRASQGLASHFDQSTTFSTVAYVIMGFGAVSITTAAAYVGFIAFRNRKAGLWTEAAGVGLLAGMILGTLTAFYMGGQTSHWVGGDHTDANGLGFFHWSTTGGDLRPAHFIGLHAAQIVPFAALSGRRRLIYFTVLLFAVVTAAVFAVGVAGIPLLRL